MAMRRNKLVAIALCLLLAVYIMATSITNFYESHEEEIVTQGQRELPPRLRAVLSPQHDLDNILQRNRELEYEQELRDHQMKGYHRKAYTTLYQPEVDGAEVVVAVFSSCTPQHASIRETIRQTWSSEHPSNIHIVFVLGVMHPRLAHLQQSKNVNKNLQAEHLRHRDILMFDFYESRKNSTLKTLSMLRWFTSTKVPFLLKSEGDVMINTNSIATMVEQSQSRAKDFVVGYALKTQPNRNIRSNSYVPASIYAPSEYPEFASGSAYGLTASAASRILFTSSRLPYIYLEDVFITGLCRQDANVSLIHSHKITLTKPSRLDELWSTLVSVGECNRKDMITLWTEIQSSQLPKPSPTHVKIM